MRVKKSIVLCSVLVGLALTEAHAQSATEYEGATALGLSLRRVGNTKRILMIGAHPDDENSQLVTRLGIGEGNDVAYLSLTRGEGGQNAIGSDQSEALGIVRTEELLAARRLDGARQFFARAYDFGFSKSADETFRHWPHDTLLADVVWVIRKYKPDVIVSVFSGTPRDGHGHHQVAGILAREAFDAAGDPNRFPEQLERGVLAFAPIRLYQSVGFNSQPDDSAMRISTGDLDPVFGRSYAQIAAVSRSRHRSQDMGNVGQAGPRSTAVRFIKTHEASQPVAGGMFSGLDTTLSTRARNAGLSADNVVHVTAYDSTVNAVRASDRLSSPAASVHTLVAALAHLQRVQLPGANAALREYIAAEAADVTDAIARSAGIAVDAIADQERLVAGQTFNVDATIWNGGSNAISVKSLDIALQPGWRVTADSAAAVTVPPGTMLVRKYHITVTDNAEVSRPYFTKTARTGDMYPPAPDSLAGLPFEPAPVRVSVALDVGGATVGIDRDVTFRGVNPSAGEFRRPLRVVNAANVALEQAAAVMSTRESLPLRFTARVTAESPAGVNGKLHVQVPNGWSVMPQDTAISLQPNETHTVNLVLRRPSATKPGSYKISVALVTPAGQLTNGYRLIDYPHIRPHALYADATARVEAVDVARPLAMRVGYIMGAGDDVPQALSQLGATVDMLGPGALGSANLSQYDAIVVGVRAYEVRPDLRAQNRRLLDYVQRGGTMLVQYGQNEYASGKYAPYPMTFNKQMDRTTDEDAAVRFLQPDARILNSPNKLTNTDFNGWVQERGLWYPQSWDSHYSPIFEMADPGEKPLDGAVLVAPYGKGVYAYTGLSLFRQLPAGVPGAFRLMSNLLSLGVKPKL